MKIGCQSITFGNAVHKDDIEFVFREVSNAGYEGVETGFFRLDPTGGQKYAELLEKYSLKLVAIHIGGDFNDEESVKKQLANIPQVIQLAKTLNCGYIFLSGQRPKEGESYDIMAKNINNLGKVLRDEGLKLNYHNHDWEIKDNINGLYTLCDCTDKENLSFVLDVGWVVRGGADPVEVIKRLDGRLENIHFKEFTADGQFTELGKGIVNFKAVYEVIKDRGSMWIIAEQDQSSIGVVESVTQNYKYIKELIS